ncbi:hypothetical protein CYFUS_009399 [Cystobacter fuscus]|uniref:AAA+ ATPase domain-containing protein n=1 Tax=Cystobacter fuscus TaxID=43 RepID=A0A250JJW6_9BACT|nr:ATP-binding protein [Cystobacter fuscus]ATB43918.1 hypothetical protein CYFUS_009399 [Cystobacter fuscus]
MNTESTSTQPGGSAYPLPSLHIQGFRAFKDLRLDNLGRVNLIVGKNNVGKSTLLEAIALYASGPEVIRELRNLLKARQEFRRPLLKDERDPSVDIYRAFHTNTSTGFDFEPTLRIAPSGSGEKSLQIKLQRKSGPFARHAEPDISAQYGAEKKGNPVSEPGLDKNQTPAAERLFTCHSIPARGLEGRQLDWLWDNIVLTDQEQDVLRSLQIIAPGIERISLAEGTRISTQGRIPLIRQKGSHDPEPLRSMGDGMNRVFELALGLANSKDGLFLVDELENGVHYSAQEQLWRLIFETASQLNVQVFATTHSWDCIEAFQRAASAHPSNGALISLARQEDGVKGTVFNERDLEIITRESIEVR